MEIYGTNNIQTMVTPSEDKQAESEDRAAAELALAIIRRVESRKKLKPRKRSISWICDAAGNQEKRLKQHKDRSAEE